MSLTDILLTGQREVRGGNNISEDRVAPLVPHLLIVLEVVVLSDHLWVDLYELNQLVLKNEHLPCQQIDLEDHL